MNNPVFSLILQRTSRCVHELKTNRYSSVQLNHVFGSEMTACFGLKDHRQATITKTLK